MTPTEIVLTLQIGLLVFALAIYRFAYANIKGGTDMR